VVSGSKSFSQIVSYGNNYLEKFRKHTEQIRRTTGRKEIIKVSSAQGQEQIKKLIEEIVITGETRQQRYMAIADALWSRKGNAIVIRQSNGEFVTFLEAGRGAALSWVD
jgi:hemerythrin-like domain-containing protein